MHRDRRAGPWGPWNPSANHALAEVDLDRLDAELDRVDESYAPQLRERWPCWMITYDLRDGGRLAFDGSIGRAAPQADDLDGDVIARRVVRQRFASS